MSNNDNYNKIKVSVGNHPNHDKKHSITNDDIINMTSDDMYNHRYIFYNLKKSMEHAHELRDEYPENKYARYMAVAADTTYADYICKDLLGTTSYNCKGIEVKPSVPGCEASIGVQVDDDMVKHMNSTLSYDNPLKTRIDINGDNHLSKDEIQTYFDLFKNDNNEISLNNLTNIWALGHNSVVSDALFGKQDKLCYNEVRDKSIIDKSDFDILDAADGKCDGYIQKSTLDAFDINGDEVIDHKEYLCGMLKQSILLGEKDHPAMMNDTAHHRLPDASPDVPPMDV